MRPDDEAKGLTQNKLRLNPCFRLMTMSLTATFALGVLGALGAMTLPASAAAKGINTATESERSKPGLIASGYTPGYTPGYKGTEVDSIRGIESLTNWTTLDTRRLTLRVNHAEQYLLTLEDHCEHLRGAQLVGVSMTNQEIWADFDHVAADGYECRIDRITHLTRG